jgi:hypothetical protein
MLQQSHWVHSSLLDDKRLPCTFSALPGGLKAPSRRLLGERRALRTAVHAWTLDEAHVRVGRRGAQPLLASHGERRAVLECG